MPAPFALTRTGPAPSAARAAKGTKRASESENESSEDEDSEDESSDNEAPPGYEPTTWQRFSRRRARRKGKELRFLVDWEGFSEDDRTWEPLANIKNCDAYKAWLKK